MRLRDQKQCTWLLEDTGLTQFCPMDGTEEVSGSLYCPIHAEKMRSLDNEFDPDNKVGKWTEEYKAALDTLSASEGGAQEGRDE